MGSRINGTISSVLFQMITKAIPEAIFSNTASTRLVLLPTSDIVDWLKNVIERVPCQYDRFVSV